MKKTIFFLFLICAALLKAETVFVSAENCTTDAVSNISYCGMVQPLNAEIQLNYSMECVRIADPTTRAYCLQANPPFLEWRNETLGLRVIAPPFPIIDRIFNMQADSTSYEFDGWALELHCTQSCTNTTITNTVYVNNGTNQTIYIALYKPFNKTVSLGFGEYFNDTETDLKVRCAGVPNLGINRILGNGEFYRDIQFGINLSCGYSNENTPFYYGNTTPPGVYCINYSQTQNCNKLFSMQTDNGTQKICFDKIEDICTPQEILQNNMRDCYERNFHKIIADQNYTAASLQQCTYNLNTWETGSKTVDAQRKQIQDVIEFASYVFVGVAILIAVALFIRRKSRITEYEKVK